MTVQNLRLNKYLKLIPATYFMLLGVSMLLTDLFSKSGFTWKQFIFMLFLSVPFFVRKVWVYLISGICYSIMFGYVFIAATVFLVRHLSGEPSHNTAVDYVRGLTFVTISLVCAFSLIWQCVDHSGHNIHVKDRL
jgi:hypothetical protein